MDRGGSFSPSAAVFSGCAGPLGEQSAQAAQEVSPPQGSPVLLKGTHLQPAQVVGGTYGNLSAQPRWALLAASHTVHSNGARGFSLTESKPPLCLRVNTQTLFCLLSPYPGPWLFPSQAMQSASRYGYAPSQERADTTR